MPASKIDTPRPGVRPAAEPAVGWLALFANGNAALAVMLTGGVAIHALSLRVVSTVMPAVVGEIGGLPFFAWTTTVAIVSAIWGAAFAASLVQACGLKRAYRISLLLFAVGSIGCAAAPNMGVFLAGRLLQGLGGGLLTALAYTTIRRVFAEHLRTRAIVLVSGIWGVAALSGPLLGGVLADWGLWRWAFWIDVPLALAVGVLAEYALRKAAEMDAGTVVMRARTVVSRLGVLGASVLAVAVGGLSGDILSSVIGLLVGGALLLMLLRIERAPPDGDTTGFRLLPSDAYRLRSALGAVSLAMALMVGTTTAVLYLPYVATETGGYSPVVGGYLSAIVSLAWTAAAFVSGSAKGEQADRSIVLGPTIMAVGLLLTGYALVLGSFIFLALALILVGGGIGLAWAHLASLMMAHAKAAERDVSSAFITTNQMIAQAFASALAGMIANIGGFADPGVGDITRAVAWLFFAFAALAALAVPAALIAVRTSGVANRPADRASAAQAETTD